MRFKSLLIISLSTQVATTHDRQILSDGPVRTESCSHAEGTFSRTQDESRVPAIEEGEIERLIDELVSVDQPGIGYSAIYFGSEFLPLNETAQIHAQVIGERPPTRSETIKKIVNLGARAVPSLLEHLDDPRTVAMEPLSGIEWSISSYEYDFNQLTDQLDTLGLDAAQSDSDIPNDESYAVAVGDLCFVALGQIVNREFSAVRYQGSGGMVVNSPMHSPSLRKAIVEEWSNFNEHQHRLKLIDDFRKPDTENRRMGAYLRLSHFYPDLSTDFLVDELRRPTYDFWLVNSFVNDELYELETREERRVQVEEFVITNGPIYSVGIQAKLLNDLESLEQSERFDFSLPIAHASKRRSRELLIELFGFSPAVTSSDTLLIDVKSNIERARFISSLVRDSNLEVSQAIRAVFLGSPNDLTTSRACLSTLVKRGDTEFVAEQLSQIDPSDSTPNRMHTCFISSATSAVDPILMRRLQFIMENAQNESYFLAGLPAFTHVEAKWIDDTATRLLDRLSVEELRNSRLVGAILNRPNRSAIVVYRNLLSSDADWRIERVCIELLREHELAVEVLAQLLENQRVMNSALGPIRVCDIAAFTICNSTDDVPFDLRSDEETRNEQISQLKSYCQSKTN